MVKFGEEQLLAISKIKEFITSSDEQAFTLVGSAGTGKTSIMMEIVKYLESNYTSFALCAPTHQAKMILEELSGHEAYTIHKLLALSPDLEILHLDMRDLRFYGKTKDNMLPHNGLVIVDEASMINDHLYDLLLKRCKEYETKVLFVGDSKQLGPVNSDYISKVFTFTSNFELTKIYRQDKESGLTDYLIELREKPISLFSNSYGLSGSLEVFDDTRNFLKDYLQLLREELGKNCSKNKLLAYTNNRVNAYNNIIKQNLFGQDDYYVGEVLRGCDNFKYGMWDFYNSIDYIILDVKESTVLIPNFSKLPSYRLVLYDTVYKCERAVEILNTSKISIDYLNSLASSIESVRIKAIEAKAAKRRSSGLYWKEYYSMIGSFACKQPLYRDSRIIKKQTFDNGYAFTVHKS